MIPRITNSWGQARTTRLDLPEISVHVATPGAAYSHHPHLLSHQQTLFATWSVGDRDEDQLGQRMVMSRSIDDGLTWSPAQTILAPEPAEFGPGIVTAEGLFIDHDGAFYALAGYYERTYLGMLMYYAAGGNGSMSPDFDSFANPHTRVLRSDDAGLTWREIVRLPNVFPNLGPMRTRGGRIVSPGNVGIAYTDDIADPTAWKRASLPRLPVDFRDDPEGFSRMTSLRGDAFGCMEMSCFELADGTLRAMFRTNKHRLASADSTDAGQTFSEPKLTDYTDANSRHHFGRLPDGRYFGLSTPVPRSPRTPLVLALAADGATFDRHFIIGDQPNTLARMPGMHKYGRYGYPFLCVHRHCAMLIYSVNKEDIRLMRIPMSQLTD
jgi:hypothetical protein